jgi:hypothetical protein
MDLGCMSPFFYSTTPHTFVLVVDGCTTVLSECSTQGNGIYSSPLFNSYHLQVNVGITVLYFHVLSIGS